jgi:hypothetical protein
MAKLSLDLPSLLYSMLAAIGVIGIAGWIFGAHIPPFFAALLVVAVAALFARALALRLSKEKRGRADRNRKTDYHGR